jgi:N-acetylmuramoyl-L-alanine amidase
MKHAKPRVKSISCPNFRSPSIPRTIDQIVIHHTATERLKAVLAWFQDDESDRSAHYVIDSDGTIYQLVAEENIAWHCTGHNTRSIGIECVAASRPLTDAQTESLASLLRHLMERYSLTHDAVTGHRFTERPFKPTQCPGHLFGDTTLASLENWKSKHL